MRCSRVPKTTKLKSFTCAVFIILSWTHVFSQTDAYSNRINWQDCIEVTYWDRDYLVCGRDKSNYPNCRAIKFRNKCQETIYVTLTFITSTGSRNKYGSGTFKSGEGNDGFGGWQANDAVAYEFEVGPPKESNGVSFPLSNGSNISGSTSSGYQTPEQREEEAKKRRLEEQRKLQEYKAEQMRKHDAAYRSSQNQSTNSYSNQQTDKSYSQNNSYDNSAEIKRKQDEAIAQKNMQQLQGAINQIKANDAATQKFSQQMQQISNATADRIAAEIEREQEELRKYQIKEAEERRIKEEERKEKEAIASIKQTYLNFIRSQKSDWPNSSFSNYPILFYYTISILEDNVIFSNVFSVGRNSGGSWPYKIDVAREIEADYDRTLSKKSTGIIFVGYYLSPEDAAYSKRNLEDEARASYLNPVSLKTKTSFGNTADNGISTKVTNTNDPWTGKAKLNPETLATSGDMPITKNRAETNDPWSNAGTKQTSVTTTKDQNKKVNATISPNKATDPWSNSVVVKSENKEPEKKSISTQQSTTQVVVGVNNVAEVSGIKQNTSGNPTIEPKIGDAKTKANTTTDPWSNPVVVKTETKEPEKRTTTNQNSSNQVVIETNKVVEGNAKKSVDNTINEPTEIAATLKKDDSGKVVIVAEKTAQPKGGLGVFYDYVSKNLKYPAAATRSKIEGKVYVEFIVNIDGSISDIKVAKGLGYGCDEEAIRLYREASPWIPAQNGGLIVRQKNVYPITFKLK